MSFNINTNLSMSSFDNSITEFNKVVNNATQQANENLNSLSNFDEVFNSISAQDQTTNPMAQSFVGMDSINAQKIDNTNVSPTAKMASDIGNSIKDGISDLNTVQKQAQDDIETFASGGDISVHQVMISAEKSKLAMQMAMQLRNQFINTYQEFKNMQV